MHNQMIQQREWSSEECSNALRMQRTWISERDDTFNAMPHLRFVYFIGNESYSEPEYFQRIVDGRLDVAEDLRQLLNVYLTKIGSGGEGRQPWYSNTVPALGFAMRAFMLLAPESTDLFQQYMVKCDREHENFCYRTILPDLIQDYGWHDRKMIRLGVFMEICVEAGGQGRGGLDRNALLAAAASQFTPNEFADAVLEELKKVMLSLWSDDPEFEAETKWQLKGFCSGLNPDVPFDAKVIEQLKPHF